MNKHQEHNVVNKSDCHEKHQDAEHVSFNVLGAFSCVDAQTASSYRKEIGAEEHAKRSKHQVDAQNYLSYQSPRHLFVIVLGCHLLGDLVELSFHLLLVLEEAVVTVFLFSFFISIVLNQPVFNLTDRLGQKPKRRRKLLDEHLNLLKQLHFTLEVNL